MSRSEIVGNLVAALNKTGITSDEAYDVAYVCHDTLVTAGLLVGEGTVCFACHKPVHLHRSGMWACSNPRCQYATPPAQSRITELEGEVVTVNTTNGKLTADLNHALADNARLQKQVEDHENDCAVLPEDMSVTETVKAMDLHARKLQKQLDGIRDEAKRLNLLGYDLGYPDWLKFMGMVAALDTGGDGVTDIIISDEVKLGPDTASPIVEAFQVVGGKTVGIKWLCACGQYAEKLVDDCTTLDPAPKCPVCDIDMIQFQLLIEAE